MVIFNKKTGKTIKITLLIIFSLIFCQSLSSQSITWQRTYIKNLQAIGNDICQTNDGNFVIAGTTVVQSVGIAVFAIKINNFGDTLWTATPLLISGHPHEGLSVTATTDGGSVIVGSGDSTFIVKLDQIGNVVWLKYYSNFTTQLFDIIRTRDGGFIACGTVLQTSTFGYIIKINDSGGLVWQRTYLGNIRGFHSIDTASGSGYIITGNYTLDTAKLLLLNINEAGDTIFQKTYKVNNRGAVGLKIINNGINYLIAGNTIDSLNHDQVFIKRTNNAGDSYFLKTLDVGIYSEYFKSIKIISENKYVICLEKDTVGNSFNNAVSLIVDSNASILKRNVFTNSNFFIWGSLREIIPLSNGDILFGGTAKLFYNNETDVYAVRTDSNLSTAPFPPIGIHNFNQDLPFEFELLQNYPNPFNPTTSIRYEIPKNAEVTLKIYDLLGKEVFSLNEYKQAGSYELKFDGSNLASGMYFYSLETNGFKDVKKMVLLK